MCQMTAPARQSARTAATTKGAIATAAETPRRYREPNMSDRAYHLLLERPINTLTEEEYREALTYYDWGQIGRRGRRFCTGRPYTPEDLIQRAAYLLLHKGAIYRRACDRRLGTSYKWVTRDAVGAEWMYWKHGNRSNHQTNQADDGLGLIEHESPVESACRNETREILSRALDSLPEGVRRRVSMKFYRGMTNREVAEVEGVTVFAINNMSKSAFARLRSVVSEIAPSIEETLGERPLHGGQKGGPPMYCLNRTQERTKQPDYAYVRVRGKRYQLGRYGSPESLRRYREVLTEYGFEVPDVKVARSL